MRSPVSALILAAVLLSACTAGEISASDPLADDSLEPVTGGVPLPPSDEVPKTDLSQHAVPLEDIHFNTFDGRSLPLAEAEDADIERLRDAIPPIERPVYVGPDGIDILSDDDLVLGYVTEDGQPIAYPIKILNFHEIVNEELAGTPLLVAYCPLCRSGVVYDRRVDGQELTFGNTSALLDNDMVMYDHQTNSYWWHIAGRAVVGELTGAELEPLPSSTTTWAEWQDRHPDTRVLSTDTGFPRSYEVDPFDGFRSAINDGQRPFPDAEVSQHDDRLDDGEEVVGVVLDGTARAYPVRTLGDAVVNDELADTPLVVFSRAEGPSGVVYDRRVEGRELIFELDEGRIVDEQTGSVWGNDGRAVDGPLTDEQLEPIPSRSSFWFAFVASFPDADVAEPQESSS